MLEMLSQTWAELTVVSDIMGQKLFRILMFGPLAQFTWLSTSRPSSSLFKLSVGDQVLRERLIVRKETVFSSVTEMTPLMFKDAFWVSPFLSSHALLKLSFAKKMKDHLYIYRHAMIYLKVLNVKISC